MVQYVLLMVSVVGSILVPSLAEANKRTRGIETPPFSLPGSLEEFLSATPPKEAVGLSTRSDSFFSIKTGDCLLRTRHGCVIYQSDPQLARLGSTRGYRSFYGLWMSLDARHSRFELRNVVDSCVIIQGRIEMRQSGSAVVNRTRANGSVSSPLAPAAPLPPPGKLIIDTVMFSADPGRFRVERILDAGCRPQESAHLRYAAAVLERIESLQAWTTIIISSAAPAEIRRALRGVTPDGFRVEVFLHEPIVQP